MTGVKSTAPEIGMRKKSALKPTQGGETEPKFALKPVMQSAAKHLARGSNVLLND
jgi:hypothetical protein